jgi:hypothetical protein
MVSTMKTFTCNDFWNTESVPSGRVEKVSLCDNAIDDAESEYPERRLVELGRSTGRLLLIALSMFLGWIAAG